MGVGILGTIRMRRLKRRGTSERVSADDAVARRLDGVHVLLRSLCGLTADPGAHHRVANETPERHRVFRAKVRSSATLSGMETVWIDVDAVWIDVDAVWIDVDTVWIGVDAV
jgi:hypothetical protein